MDPILITVGLAYAAANIGLLCSIKFHQGKGAQAMIDHERRISKLEGQVDAKNRANQPFAV